MRKKRIEIVKNQLSKITIHIKIGEYILTDVLLDFDATGLYLSAMWDEKSIYPKSETVCAFAPDMRDEFVEKISTQSFSRENANLKVLYSNASEWILQHLAVREKVKKTQINKLRNGHVIDAINSVDIQKIVKLAGKVLKIYEFVFYTEIFKRSPFRKVIEILFKVRHM